MRKPTHCHGWAFGDFLFHSIPRCHLHGEPQDVIEQHRN